MKVLLQQQAISLRKQGFSYSQILSQVPVAKSTLSLWLRSVGLSKSQIQRLTEKRLIAARKGAQIRKQQRLQITQQIKEEAFKELGEISDRELWLTGIILYWAEGSKAKEHNISQGVIFSNSDPYMIKLFLLWLTKSIDIPAERIVFEIFIHEEHKGRVGQIKNYWADTTGFSIPEFGRIYFKRGNPQTLRRNIGDSYFGQLRIKVKESTNLNRKIAGWYEGLAKYCGVV